MTKLKPCPFCGGEALLNEFPVRKGYEASIQCDGGCYCFALMTTITYDFPDQAREAVIAAWNRRDGEEQCPCDDCDATCDYWDSKYCCIYCRWQYGDIEPDCENCDPMDI